MDQEVEVLDVWWGANDCKVERVINRRAYLSTLGSACMLLSLVILSAAFNWHALELSLDICLLWSVVMGVSWAN